ncbi:MAG TPA: DUF1778 domain-containing protein [Acidimicrobiales bacterium]|nr:DUF1778 domain-containing protein [Acidimicrobiales bacterium]
MDSTVGRIHYEIPEDVHRDAKAAAGVEGLTLKEFLIEALRERAQDVLRRRAGEIERGG